MGYTLFALVIGLLAGFGIHALWLETAAVIRDYYERDNEPWPLYDWSQEN